MDERIVPDSGPIVEDLWIGVHSGDQSEAYASDTDMTNGGTLTLVGVGNATNGQTSMGSAGSLAVVYQANMQGWGSDSFTYTMSDENGNLGTGTVHVDVWNDAPYVEEGFADIFVNETAYISPMIYDMDGDDVDIISVCDATNGTVTALNGSSFNFVPNLGWHGTEVLTYSVADPHGAISTGTYTITVSGIPNEAPYANDVYATTYANEIATIPIDAYDMDGNTITVTEIGTPTTGYAFLNEDGTIEYIPNLETGSYVDTFTYTVSDGRGGETTAIVNITVLDAELNPTYQMELATDLQQYTADLEQIVQQADVYDTEYNGTGSFAAYIAMVALDDPSLVSSSQVMLANQQAGLPYVNFLALGNPTNPVGRIDLSLYSPNWSDRSHPAGLYFHYLSMHAACTTLRTEIDSYGAKLRTLSAQYVLLPMAIAAAGAVGNKELAESLANKWFRTHVEMSVTWQRWMLASGSYDAHYNESQRDQQTAGNRGFNWPAGVMLPELTKPQDLDQFDLNDLKRGVFPHE